MATPESFFELPTKSNHHRQQQTRMFEISDEKELLSASAAVLQDLGFQVEEVSMGVGLLRAAKERSASEIGQEIRRVLFYFLCLGQCFLPVDLHQQNGATLVTRQVEGDASRFTVRILFHRTVWKGPGQIVGSEILPGEQRMEVIDNGEIYRKFFAKLSKGLFLEAQQI